MQKTNIGWCSHTSNPLVSYHHETGKRGWVCTRISDGCSRCYAEALNLRLGTRLPYNKASEDLVTWELHAPELAALRKHQGPATIFLCSMTDLWHQRVPTVWIDQILQDATTNPQHTVMTLTKRAERLIWYFNSSTCRFDGRTPNLMVGVTVENRATMWRIGVLQLAKVAKRFLSCEPLLEDLGTLDLRGIDLVIVGGESGPKRRPMQVSWVEAIQQQCEGAGVRYFGKQGNTLRPGQQGTLPNALYTHREG